MTIPILSLRCPHPHPNLPPSCVSDTEQAYLSTRETTQPPRDPAPTDAAPSKGTSQTGHLKLYPGGRYLEELQCQERRHIHKAESPLISGQADSQISLCEFTGIQPTSCRPPHQETHSLLPEQTSLGSCSSALPPSPSRPPPTPPASAKPNDREPKGESLVPSVEFFINTAFLKNAWSSFRKTRPISTGS